MLNLQILYGRFGLVLLGASLLLLPGCPQQKIVNCKSNEEYNSKLGVCVPCPTGTKLDRNTGKCTAVEPDDDATVWPDTGLDQHEPDLKDQKEDQGQDLVVDETGPELDLTPPDVHEIVEEGAIGSSCNLDGDCDNGLTCFDWPGGYCIKTSCATSEDCPAGSFCMPLLDNGQACFQGCENSQQCRPGYGCKGLSELGGVTRNICHPVNDQTLDLGKKCEGAEECAGSMGCVPLGPVSMCTVTGCSDQELCPDGSECVPLTTVPVCLPRCGSDSECDSAFGEMVACQEMTNIFNKDVSTCASANIGLAIGQQCYFNSECSTGYCHLIFVGKCTDSGKLCGSDRDCEQGFCTEDPSSQRGVCSKSCGSGDSCPTGNLCVMSDGTPVCMPLCYEAGKECGPSGFDMSCTFGWVYYPQAPSGKLACVRNKSGDAGTDCNANADCTKGDCFYQTGGEGYCMADCVSHSQCSFGSACVGSDCRRMCTSDLECPTGQSCLNDAGAPDKICNYPL